MHFLVFLLLFTNLLLTVIRYTFDPFVNETTRILLFVTQVVINVSGVLYYIYYLLAQEMSQQQQFPTMGQQDFSQQMSPPTQDGGLITPESINLLQSLLGTAAKGGKSTTKNLGNLLIDSIKNNPELLSNVTSALLQ